MNNPATNTGPAEVRAMLTAEGEHRRLLSERAAALKRRCVGSGVYLRGLIEYSNVCRKNCYYCGIRKDAECERYTLSESRVMAAARFAWENNYGSVVIQGGENTSPGHVETISKLIRAIKSMSGGELGITLSLGEQSPETYREWFAAGAHRYLLRIEDANEDLYEKIHPDDGLHGFSSRVKALHDIREAGYQLGTGVMIGLPGQTLDDLANDLLFMRELDIDMCGMGPYIISDGTPLAEGLSSDELRSEQWRLEMTLRMIAALRIIMPDINIAATTALQAITPEGRLMALEAGANVVMPNVSPDGSRPAYSLYNNKPLRLDSSLPESDIRYGEWGDSVRFESRRRR